VGNGEPAPPSKLLQTRHRVQAPLFRHALERVHPTIVDEIPDPATRSLTVLDTRISPPPGCSGDACAGVDGDSSGFVAHEFALARMDAHPNVKLDIAQAAADRARAVDGTGRPVEGREQDVAGRVGAALVEKDQPREGGESFVEVPPRSDSDP
jgi:hypothetical protein